MRSVVLPANCSPRPNHNPSHNTPQHYVTSTLSMIPRNSTTINITSHTLSNNGSNNSALSKNPTLFEIQMKPLATKMTAKNTRGKKTSPIMNNSAATAAQLKYTNLPSLNSSTTSYLSHNHHTVTALIAECTQQQQQKQKQQQSPLIGANLKDLIGLSNLNNNNDNLMLGNYNLNQCNGERTGSLSSLTESDLSEYCANDLLSDEGSSAASCLDDPMFDDIIGSVDAVVSSVDDLDLLLESDGESLHFTSSELSE